MHVCMHMSILPLARQLILYGNVTMVTQSCLESIEVHARLIGDARLLLRQTSRRAHKHERAYQAWCSCNLSQGCTKAGCS